MTKATRSAEPPDEASALGRQTGYGRGGGASDDHEPAGTFQSARARKATLPILKSRGALMALVQTGV